MNLMPFLLGLIPPDSPKVASFLSMLGDKNQLWSDYGILSLSRQDELFGKGENYWRGPIWYIYCLSSFCINVI